MTNSEISKPRMANSEIKLSILRMVMEFGNSLDRTNPEEKVDRLYQFVIKEDKPLQAPRKPGRPKVGSTKSTSSTKVSTPAV